MYGINKSRKSRFSPFCSFSSAKFQKVEIKINALKNRKLLTSWFSFDDGVSYDLRGGKQAKRISIADFFQAKVQ